MKGLPSIEELFDQLDGLTSQQEEKRERLLRDLLVKTVDEPGAFRCFVRGLDLNSETGSMTYNNAIEVMAEDTVAWEGFLREELDRVLDFCDRSLSPHSAFGIGAFAFLESADNPSLEQAGLETYLRGLHSKRARLCYECIDLLGGFIIADTPSARLALEIMPHRFQLACTGQRGVAIERRGASAEKLQAQLDRSGSQACGVSLLVTALMITARID